jgi:V8-like Glu-specific endopeptidase
MVRAERGPGLEERKYCALRVCGCGRWPSVAGPATVDLPLGIRKPIPVALTVVAVALPATALAFALRDRAEARSANVGRLPAAARSSGVSEIGGLYASPRATQHGCTASVVQSPRGNILMTAAHCVSGRGVGMVFAPGQHGAQTPYGRWTVTAAYVEPRWMTGQDPQADVAFLSVAPRRVDGVSMEIEQVTGAYALGATAVRGEQVTITGYPAGSTNAPITCATKVYLSGTYASFDCRGFVDGTSGSPWLRATKHGPQIVGVIGGLDQGGCEDYTSYSSPLGHDARIAYRRASRSSGAGDVVPRPRGDGC